MHQTMASDYEKVSPSLPTGTAPYPPPYFATSTDQATGIPVSSQYYSNQNQAPPPLPPITQVPLTDFSTGLCDCHQDVSNCCMTFWCPCVTFGRIAEIVDKGSSSCGASAALYTLIALVLGCPCFYSCFYRSKLRLTYNLKGSCCGDCCLHCLCEGCALCQEYRELKNRGVDMEIGWHGNVDRQNRGVAMAPVVHDGMSR
ncbi:hypothetical protein GIB67_000101 [Kingdonia uniflora]|uniref:Uncharacterized protein n=1 Tax=Kingdonia uniflora TaxID=39325 RepID=A0A7J7M5S2_9MAGN|nr:hypothetical protein GIB67_000101 [Kingdonia uniflora]